MSFNNLALLWLADTIRSTITQDFLVVQDATASSEQSRLEAFTRIDGAKLDDVVRLGGKLVVIACPDILVLCEPKMSLFVRL